MKNLKEVLEDLNTRYDLLLKKLKKNIITNLAFLILFSCLTLISKTFIHRCIDASLLIFLLIMLYKSFQQYIQAFQDYKNITDEINILTIIDLSLKSQLDHLTTNLESLKLKSKYDETKARLTDLIGPDFEDI
jgi:hypothetical protein